jgi:hypothetical protein
MTEVLKLNELGSSSTAVKNQPPRDRRLVRAANTEVPERPRRRKFSAYSACPLGTLAKEVLPHRIAGAY